MYRIRYRRGLTYWLATFRGSFFAGTMVLSAALTYGSAELAGHDAEALRAVFRAEGLDAASVEVVGPEPDFTDSETQETE